MNRPPSAGHPVAAHSPVVPQVAPTVLRANVPAPIGNVRVRGNRPIPPEALPNAPNRPPEYAFGTLFNARPPQAAQVMRPLFGGQQVAQHPNPQHSTQPQMGHLSQPQMGHSTQQIGHPSQQIGHPSQPQMGQSSQSISQLPSHQQIRPLNGTGEPLSPFTFLSPLSSEQLRKVGSYKDHILLSWGMHFSDRFRSLKI